MTATHVNGRAVIAAQPAPPWMPTLTSIHAGPGGCPVSVADEFTRAAQIARDSGDPVHRAKDRHAYTIVRALLEET